MEKIKLTDKEKLAIDIAVNGSIMILGLLVIVTPQIGIEGMKLIVGLLAIYIGVRHFPRI